MDAGFYLGIHTLYSASKTYRIDIHKEIVDGKGNKVLSAIVMKKIRSYWEPVAQGVCMSETEVNNYLDQ